MLILEAMRIIGFTRDSKPVEGFGCINGGMISPARGKPERLPVPTFFRGELAVSFREGNWGNGL